MTTRLQAAIRQALASDDPVAAVEELLLEYGKYCVKEAAWSTTGN